MLKYLSSSKPLKSIFLLIVYFFLLQQKDTSYPHPLIQTKIANFQSIITKTCTQKELAFYFENIFNAYCLFSFSITTSLTNYH